MKQINDYPNYYITSDGKVWSEKNNMYLKPQTNKHKYLFVNLHHNGKQKSIKIHSLVAIYYLNHIPCGNDLVIDHIDNDKLNNDVKNLQIITNRYNSSKDRNIKKGGLTGAYYKKSQNTWCSCIRINYKLKFIGYYDTKELAHEAYKNELKKLENEKQI